MAIFSNSVFLFFCTRKMFSCFFISKLGFFLQNICNMYIVCTYLLTIKMTKYKKDLFYYEKSVKTRVGYWMMCSVRFDEIGVNIFYIKFIWRIFSKTTRRFLTKSFTDFFNINIHSRPVTKVKFYESKSPIWDKHLFVEKLFFGHPEDWKIITVLKNRGCAKI